MKTAFASRAPSLMVAVLMSFLALAFAASTVSLAADTVSNAKSGHAVDTKDAVKANAKTSGVNQVKDDKGAKADQLGTAPAAFSAASGIEVAASAPETASAAENQLAKDKLCKTDGGMKHPPVDDGTPNAPLWVKGKMCPEGTSARIELSVGDYIILSTTETLEDLLKKNTTGHHLGLYFNDLFFKDLPPLPVPGRPNAAMFHLVRTDVNKDQWSALFAHKGLSWIHTKNDSTCDADPKDGVTVTAGYTDGGEVSPRSNWACLEYFPNPWAAAGLAFMALVLLVFTWWKSKTTSIIRDIGITPSGTLPPYSLARFQMALWFVTVICAILFCYAVTGDLSPIPQNVLVLMGIGAATAVSSAAIDVNALPGTFADYRQIKQRQGVLDAKVQSLTDQIAKASPTDITLSDLNTQLNTAKQEAAAGESGLKNYKIVSSKGFLTDILADGNGLAFHRLQVFSWTIVYWIVFMVALIHKISLMEFDTTALALMGISGATYLGFKLQQPSKATGDPSDTAGKGKPAAGPVIKAPDGGAGSEANGGANAGIEADGCGVPVVSATADKDLPPSTGGTEK